MIRRTIQIVLLIVALSACNMPGLGGRMGTPVPTQVPSTQAPTPGDETPAATATRRAEHLPTQSAQSAPTARPGEIALPFLMGPAKVTRYMPQSGSPAELPNFVQPEAGCNWSGVAGQVFDTKGSPVTGLVVELSGSLEGKKVSGLGLTGAALNLGPGGYEIKLSDHAVASQGSLALQLFDLKGVPVSPRVSFDTFADCEKNTILLNFGEVSLSKSQYFPLIHKTSKP